jgi:hypothetical protein
MHLNPFQSSMPAPFILLKRTNTNVLNEDKDSIVAGKRLSDSPILPLTTLALPGHPSKGCAGSGRDLIPVRWPRVQVGLELCTSSLPAFSS